MKESVSAAIHPTAASFDDEVLGSGVPVLVDFWATWCPPCQLLKPEVERLAAELHGRARVALVNVDQEPELAARFGVSSIPFLMIIKDGQRVDTWTGYSPRGTILARIEPHLVL